MCSALTIRYEVFYNCISHIFRGGSRREGEVACVFIGHCGWSTTSRRPFPSLSRGLFRILDLDCPFSPLCLSASHVEVGTRPFAPTSGERNLARCATLLTPVNCSSYLGSLETRNPSILDSQGTESPSRIICFFCREDDIWPQ